MDKQEIEKKLKRTTVHFVPAEDKRILPLPAFVTKMTLKELLGTRSLDTLASTPSHPEKKEQS